MPLSLPSLRTVLGERSGRRRTVRYVAAAASMVTALLYFGIGAGVLVVVDETVVDAPGMFEFGATAGLAFVVGAVLLLALDHRILWLLGAGLEVAVIVMYVAIAPQRAPSFEVWGLLVKLLQILILCALAYLILRSPSRGGVR